MKVRIVPKEFANCNDDSVKPTDTIPLPQINTALNLGRQELFELGRNTAMYNFEDYTHNDRQLKWDRRFLEVAKLIASWSKDPSTQTGAVIVDQNKRIISCGYNGFAKGADDSPERYADRDLKYKLIVHCERNAIIFAQRNLEGCTLYTWPFMSCSVCAAMVIQSGITRCVAPPIPADKAARWEEDMKLSRNYLEECGVTVDIVEME